MSKGLAAFFGTLALLALLRVGMANWLVPDSLRLPLSLLVTIAFIALPILALFYAGSHRWTVGLGIAFVLIGAAIQFGLPLVFPAGKGSGAIWVDAISQQGLPIWTVGLGALLALLLKDRNLLIPVSIFLALFDIFLVFTPVGFVQTLMKNHPKLLPAMAHKIPEIATSPTQTGAPVGTFAHIGPADFLFMGMFFVAIFKFGMPGGRTLKWLLVALAVYLPLAFLVGPVPLLVPIGLAVLFANWKEFNLNKEEKVSTAVVAVIGLAIIAYSATRPRPVPPTEPSPVEGGQAPGGLANSPSPTSPDRLPSESPAVPKSTPGRR